MPMPESLILADFSIYNSFQEYLHSSLQKAMPVCKPASPASACHGFQAAFDEAAPAY
jgi:hypothetical protein